MVEKHVHKYFKVIYPSGWVIFKCVLNCTHFIDSKLLAGREAICWRCGESFIISEKHVLLKKPHCDNCTRTTKEDKGLRELRKQIMGA